MRIRVDVWSFVSHVRAISLTRLVGGTFQATEIRSAHSSALAEPEGLQVPYFTASASFHDNYLFAQPSRFRSSWQPISTQAIIFFLRLCFRK